MIWWLRWGERWIYLYLLLEFHLSVDRFMAVRGLTDVELLDQDLAAAGEIPVGSPLPPVLPIVLYKGEKSWWAKTSLDELIEPDLPEQRRRLLIQRFGALPAWVEARLEQAGEAEFEVSADHVLECATREDALMDPD